MKADFDGVPVQFINRQDLIASKLAAGRPQDLIDAASLAQATGSKTSAQAQEEDLTASRLQSPNDYGVALPRHLE